MSHPNGHAPEAPPLPFYDEGERRLYELACVLQGLSSEFRVKTPGPHDIKGTLHHLYQRDQEGTRQIVQHLRIAGAALAKANHLLHARIDWEAVEAFYCPPEGGFIDVPPGQVAKGFADVQRAQNGANGHAPVVPPAPAITLPEPGPEDFGPVMATPEPADGPSPDQPVSQPEAFPPEQSPAALRRLAKSLRNGTKREENRFYATARERGLRTDSAARGAILAALSTYLGETITSRTQMDELRWGKAASAVYCEDLRWDVAAPVPTPRRRRARPAAVAP